MNTDPIADLLSRIRNALRARQLKTVVPHSNMKVAILKVMKKRHFINDYMVVENQKSFKEIQIDFTPELKTINLKRVSKPGQRIYVKINDIKPVYRGYGIGILSTPRGVMAADEAAKQGVGGEYLCEIW